MLMEMVVYWLGCEECDENSEHGYRLSDALAMAESAGWLVDTSDPEYIASWCPKCRQEAEHDKV